MNTPADTPKVAVVMSVYNGAQYVAEAVRSILGQTHKDFEFIIINDGSTDTTAAILQSFNDPRMRVLNQKNKGLVASLNRGIQEAAAPLVARQDADDRSEPTRLQSQVTFMQSHPDVVAVGSSMSVMDSSGNITHKHAVLLNDPELRQELLIRSPFAHGSVLFRKDAAISAGLYNQVYWPAEDYDFWLRLANHGRLANLDEYLYVYRENTGGISDTNAAKQASQVAAIQKQAWATRGSCLRGTIPLHMYQTKDMGQVRTQRIIDNVATVTKQAFHSGSLFFGLKNLSLLRRNPRSLLSALRQSIINRQPS